MTKMNSRERVAAVLKGNPVDRPPIAFWGHHYDVEYSLAGHVSSALWWQRYLDLDILKVQCRASYHGEDWGLRFSYPEAQPFVGVDHGYLPPEPPVDKPQLVTPAVSSLKDWGQLLPLKPTLGALGERLAALEAIKAGLERMGQDPLVIETVFNPISIAARLVGCGGGQRREILLKHMREQPDIIHGALQVITSTFRDYVRAVLKTGIDGIFFATTDWASYDLLTADEYAEFGRQYDLQVLDAMQDGLIVFHVCNQNNMLLELGDYPVDVFSWAPSDPGNPSLSNVQQNLSGKVVMGGISNAALSESVPANALAEAQAAYNETNGKGWICAPNCSVWPTSPVNNMLAVSDYVRSLGKP